MRFIIILISIFTTLTVFSQEPLHYVIGKDVFDGVNLYSAIQDSYDNSVWITSNKGLYNYDGKDITFQVPDDVKNTSLFGLTKDKNNHIYCFNLNGQIFKIVNKKVTLFYTIPDEYVKNGLQIIFDNSNNLLITSYSTLLKLSLSSRELTVEGNTGYTLANYDNTFYYYKKNKKRAFSLIKKTKDTVYKVVNFTIGQKEFSPLKYFFEVNDKYYSYNLNNKGFLKLEEKAIKSFKQSFINNTKFKPYHTNKTFWFSDYKNGVFKFPEDKIETYYKPQKWFSDYYISEVMTDNEKNTWLLTFGKGIIIIPNNNIKIESHSIPDKTIKSVYKSDNNTLFIGTDLGNVYKLNNRKIAYYKSFKNVLLENFSVYPKEDIIVTNDRIIKKDQIIQKGGFRKKNILRNDTIFSATISGFDLYDVKRNKRVQLSSKRSTNLVYEKADTTFWVSTALGLYQYHNFIEKPFLVNQKRVYARKLLNVNNQIWATTNNGILILEKGRITDSLTVESGLLSNAVSDIKIEKPYVYISSSLGLQRYDTSNKQFKNITKSDGLTQDIISFEVIKDTIYTVHDNKILRFKFEDIKQHYKKYQTNITKVVVNGNRIISNKTTLAAEENNIEFSFLTTSYKHKNINYQYQLIGFEEKPIKARSNYVNYSNLPAGTYTFKVDSFINKHKNESADFTFTIKKAWYQTALFKIIIIGFCLLMTYLIYQSRINILKRKKDNEEMKKRLAESTLRSLKAQMNPHFLFNAMNGVQSLILEGERYQGYGYLTKLSNFVRDNLSMSEQVFIPIQKEIEFLKRYLELEKFRFDDNFKYEINAGINDVNLLKIPSMIIQPFVENSVKHGLLHKKEDRFLQIEFKQEKSIIVCTVTDNGIGRVASKAINEKEEKTTSFSTSTIENRFEILKIYYKLDIGFTYYDLHSNNKPSGTKVVIKIPFTKHE